MGVIDWIGNRLVELLIFIIRLFKFLFYDNPHIGLVFCLILAILAILAKKKGTAVFFIFMAVLMLFM